MPQFTSLNFEFLNVHDRQLVQLGASAERYFSEDPNTCLIKLRQFGELLAQLVAVKVGIQGEGSQQDLLRLLGDRKIVGGDVEMAFHELRKLGNQAVHHLIGDQRQALQSLKYAHFLGSWFHRSFGDSSYKRRAFVPPTAPVDSSIVLQQELAILQTEMRKSLTQAELATAEIAIEIQRRIQAEELAAQVETDRSDLEAHIMELQAKLLQTAKPILTAIDQAQKAYGSMQLSEAETRQLIDVKLREAGWEADSVNLTYGNGVRPTKGKNQAIAEYPTKNGRADYILFVGLLAVGVIEAKKSIKNVYGAIDQAKRYSYGFRIKGEDQLATGAPWDDCRLPFVFSTNSKPHLRQLEHQSGIWFCDLRRSQNLRRAIGGWYTPEGLMDQLNQDIDLANTQLEAENFYYGFELRPYQVKAIKSVERALADDRRNLLLAMATGTGKTKTCIALVYRLLKTKRFRRVLFLVDRTALGEQATGAFKETRMESLQTFADIFEIKELKDKMPDRDTKVQIATVQSFVQRLLYPSDNKPKLTVDQYDCIVVDECHRGYLLDRELSENELTFRDFGDYISKYRQVLEYFDAVKIGLTATPALHTKEIFGAPVYTYSYREAVIDGFLIDHEPPIQIKTELSEEGIVWKPGDAMEYYDPKTGKIDLINAPDEIQVDIEQFNRRVITESFNQVVCEAIADRFDPTLVEMGKMLIFCVNEDHAVLVTHLLKQALQERYPDVGDDDVLKITGASDQPLQMIRKLKNEVSPRVAVTVDLLTTGIDVPEITHLVFLRRVKSRILYEQMIGRATRLCPEIGKEVFQIFDAVGLYEAIEPFSTMKPVVNPNISFRQLVDELGRVTETGAIDEILGQFLAKWQRKKQHLSDSQREQIATVSGMAIEQIPQYLKQLDPIVAANWISERSQIAEMLDRREGETSPMLISYHADQLRSVTQGYGAAESGIEYGRPEDYLESFKAFIERSQNEIPAILVVMQRPRELTREDLKSLRLALDGAGYSEVQLRSAWRNATNEDIAASIIGFIRQAALGDALVPYGDRVQRALKKILMQRAWTAPQRKWLERIGKQLELEYVVDVAAMDQGLFKSEGGGFDRINKVFGGELGAILQEIGTAIWEPSVG